MERPAADPEAGDRLVGRSRELHHLHGALSDALRGRGRLVLLGGEAGIGKTSLADELSGAAADRGATVIWARCWDSGGAPPYWPWIEVVRTLLRRLDVDDVRADLGLAAGHVAALVGEVGELLKIDAVEPEAGADADAIRFARCDALATFLRNVSRRTPLVLVLDDLHGADASSLTLLRLLARSLRGEAMLLLGTYRRDPRLGGELTEIAREGDDLVVGGLDEAEVAELVQRRWLVEDGAAVGAALHAATGGNPLFILQLLAALDAEGAMTLDEASTTAMLALGGARDAIRRRFAGLSPSTREVLEAASVLGVRFDLALLACMTGEPLTTVAGAVDEAVRSRILERGEAGAGAYAFVHSLLRDTLYDDLPAARRMDLHAAAASAMEAGGATAGAWATVAHHHVAAGPTADPDRRLAALVEAASHAMSLAAYADAADTYQTALSLLDPERDASTRVTTLTGLGDALLRAGQAALAWHPLEEALTLAAEVPAVDHGAAVLVWVRAARELLAEGARTIGEIEAALARLPETEPDLEIGLLDELVHAHLDDVRLGHDPGAAWARACAAAARAEDASARSGKPECTVRALRLRLSTTPQLEPSKDLVETLLEASARCRDPALTGIGPHALATIGAEAGDAARLDAGLVSLTRIGTASQQPVFTARAREGLIARALFEGDLVAAGRLLDEQEASPQPLIRWRSGPARTALLVAHDELDQAAALLRQNLEQSAQPMTRARFGLVLAELGDMAGAAQQLESALLHPLVRLDRERPYPWTATVTLLADLACAVNDERAVGQLEGLLAPFPDAVAFYALMVGVGPISTTLARCSVVQGDYSTAVTRAQAGAAAAARLRAATWVAEAQLIEAEARAALGDRARADSLVAAVVARAVEARWARLARLGRQAQERLRIVEAPRDAVLRRVGSRWEVGLGGCRALLPDQAGLRQLAVLVTHAWQEVPALDLVAAAEGRSPERDATARAAVSGDAGEMLDAEAKAAYKRRVDELREELSAADALADVERAVNAQAELDFIARELAAAVGLGGRDRRAASNAERARQSVQKRLRAAIDRIAEEVPELGQHLRSTVRTGASCGYQPPPHEALRWNTESER